MAISRFALGPSMALYFLYGPLPPLRSNPSTALCPPPPYSVLSKALCPLYSPLPPLRPSFLSMALSSLYGALFPLRPWILSMTLCSLNSHLPALPPSVSSTALCPLYRPLCPWRPSVHSTALCLLYGSLSLYGLLFTLRPSENSKTTSLVSWNVLQNAFRQNSKGFRDLFRISDDRDHHDNHDYHSSEILSDNREIAIIALAKKVSITAIITSNKKR